MGTISSISAILYIPIRRDKANMIQLRSASVGLVFLVGCTFAMDQSSLAVPECNLSCKVFGPSDPNSSMLTNMLTNPTVWMTAAVAGILGKKAFDTAVEYFQSKSAKP